MEKQKVRSGKGKAQRESGAGHSPVRLFEQKGREEMRGGTLCRRSKALFVRAVLRCDHKEMKKTRAEMRGQTPTKERKKPRFLPTPEIRYACMWCDRSDRSHWGENCGAFTAFQCGKERLLIFRAQPDLKSRCGPEREHVAVRQGHGGPRKRKKKGRNKCAERPSAGEKALFVWTALVCDHETYADKTPRPKRERNSCYYATANPARTDRPGVPLRPRARACRCTTGTWRSA